MSTGRVARRLIELCRAGQFDRAVDELYADNARSIEPDGALGAQGLPAIRRKAKAFQDEWLAVHSVLVSDPLIAGPFFTIALGLDATQKDGRRRALNEVCLYEVRDGKIVREQFFHGLTAPQAATEAAAPMEHA
jgi:hypothetical protein